MSDERQRLTLLIEERQKRQAEAEQALECGAPAGPTTLARQADTLKDLIAKLEQENTAAARAAQAAARPMTQEGHAAHAKVWRR